MAADQPSRPRNRADQPSRPGNRADQPSRPGNRADPALIISLDVDLAWGGRADPPIDLPIDLGLAAIRRVLDLFVEREIHATWAFVGPAFARDAADARGFLPSSLLERVDPRELDAAPDRFFAPELIASIAARPHQEIGVLSCSTTAELEAELVAAIALARREGLELRSLAFADNRSRTESLPILARHGIACFRGPRPGWAHLPSRSPILAAVRRGLRWADNFSLAIPDAVVPLDRLDADLRRGQPVEIPACRFVQAYDPRLARLESLRVHRMQSEMTHAAEHGRVHHLWLRPLEFGLHIHENLVTLDHLLRNAKALAGRVGLRSLTLSEWQVARGGG